MAELLPTLTSIAAVLFFVFALLSRRRLLETRALLADASVRVDSAQKQSRQFEQNHRNQQDQFDRLRQQNQALEKAFEETKQRLAERTLEWNRLKQEREEFVEKASLQREHLAEQVQVLTQQLAEVIREKKLVAEDGLKLQREFDDKANKQAEVLRGQLRESQMALNAARRDKQQAESQIGKIKEQIGQVQPEELKRYKLKVLRLEQLYTSMRGLREMAEERNRNWETALRYFAEFIMQPRLSGQQLALGPLVGAALEKIGATLVDETVDEANGEIDASDLQGLDAIPGSAGEDLMPVQL